MEDYSKKYEKFLNPEESYQFLLKVQKDITRLARNKNIKEFYNLLSFSMNHINKILMNLLLILKIILI